MKRRDFIKSSGVIEGGLILTVNGSMPGIAAPSSAEVNSIARAAMTAASKIGNFLEIVVDGGVVFHCAKHNVGQV